MSSINVFENTYYCDEDRLTYNFLCMLGLMDGCAQKLLLEFMLASDEGHPLKLADAPVVEIQPVYFWSGKGSNPDGCIRIIKDDRSEFSLYLEVKTYRRELDQGQLRAHLAGHCTNPNDMLLVITPRPSDATLARSVDRHRIRFVSWQQIADFLVQERKALGHSAVIADQFVEHANSKKEFMSSELTKEDIIALSRRYTHNPEGRMASALQRLATEFDYSPFFSPIRPPYYFDAWGRKTVEIILQPDEQKIWLGFGLYYDKQDHCIPWKTNSPELALFIDTAPSNRERFLADPAFVADLIKLENEHGFIENLTKRPTSNPWRLAWWTEPIINFEKLDVPVLSSILYEKLTLLKSKPDFARIYFQNQ